MNKIFTLSCLAMFAVNAHAQITITQANYASWTPGVDSFREFTTSGITPTTNGSWDMSTAAYLPGSFGIPKFAYTGTAIPGASYFINSGYGFSSLFYNVKLCYGISSQGLSRLGETIDRQAFSITAATTGAQDSLVILGQDIPYSSGKMNLGFPATMSSHWASDYTYNTNLQLSILAYGMNHTPGYRRTRVTQKDSVVGWGRLRVKNLDSVTSGWINVLAVKSINDVVDSFYLNGAPAPATLLTGLGLSQGMMDHVYRVSYFRPGEVESMMVIQYTDATFTTVQSADLHLNRLPVAPTAVNNISESNTMKLYPNPVANGGKINIEIAETNPGMWSYSLSNIAGQVISKEALNLNGGKAQIQMRNTEPGTYILSVNKDGRPISAKHFVIKN